MVRSQDFFFESRKVHAAPKTFWVAFESEKVLLCRHVGARGECAANDKSVAQYPVVVFRPTVAVFAEALYISRPALYGAKCFPTTETKDRFCHTAESPST